MPLHKSHLVDKWPWWGAALLAVCYLVSFFICVGVGASGPGPANSFPDALQPPPATSLACGNPLACTVTATVSMDGLTGYSQALWIVMSMDRPNDTSTGALALAGAALTVPVDFAVTAAGAGAADGSAAQLAANASGAGSLYCAPGGRTCGAALVFAQPFLYYSSYTVSVTVLNPWAGFILAGMAPGNVDTSLPVGLRFNTGTVNPAFTRFQITAKYTFFALSLILYAAWIALLLRGAGGRDPENHARRLPSTQEQVWLTVLGGWLIWANDPFAAVSLTAPSFAASGFYAFCATTFLVLLLLYWMVIFDLARDPAKPDTPASMQPLGGTAQLARRCSCGAFAAAVLFWAPKVIWSVVTWVLVLSFYLVQRASQLADPTYNILTAIPLLQRYFVTFTAAWGAIYVIYIIVLLLSGLYQCRVIAPTSRYILFITIVTLAACLAGLFLNGVLPTTATNSSVVFMTAQGAANVYIYFLMIAYAPALPHSAREAAMAQVRDDEAAARGGSTLTVYGGIPDAPAKLRALSEAYTQTDDSALQPGDGNGDSMTMPITIVGADFGGAPPPPPPPPPPAADSPPPGMHASGVGGAFSFGASAVAAPPRAASGKAAVPNEAVSDPADEETPMPGAADGWK